MNINAILNTTRPVSLYEKEKDTRNTGFLDVLAQRAKEASLYGNECPKCAERLEDMNKSNAELRQKYTHALTDEEAEYFRKKYGENYDEKSLADFFYELQAKGIITVDEAFDASCCFCSRSVEIVGAPPGVDPVKWAAVPVGVADPHEWLASRGVKLVSGELGYSKTRNVLEREYEDFKKDYTKDTITWADYMREQSDFYEYMKTRDTVYNYEGENRPNDPPSSYEERLERLESVAAIINQIFGQSAGGDI